MTPGDVGYPDCSYEMEAKKLGYSLIAGVDEAGRGPLAGPVVVASYLFFGHCLAGINDSKKLTAKKRKSLFLQIKADPKSVYAIEIVDAAVIDRVNIFQATLQGMRESVVRLAVKPDFVLVDGSHLPELPVPGKAIVQGDALCYSIACASILAKETRDALMEEYDKQWPQYGFAKHKGYPTQEHLRALELYGPCPIHRTSFGPVRDLLVENNI